MATKQSRRPKSYKRVADAPRLVDLADITDNEFNPRNAVPTLSAMGYSVFPNGKSKKSLWSLGTGTPAEQAEYCKLIEAHEPDIARMGLSLMVDGQMQPVRVRQTDEGITLIYGCVRCLGLMFGRLKSGLPLGTVRADVETKITNTQCRLKAISENFHRIGQGKVETAKSWAILISSGSMTVEQIADRFGVSKGTVKNYLELAKAPDEVLTQVADGELNIGDAIKMVAAATKSRDEQAAVASVQNEIAARPGRKSPKKLLAYNTVLDMYCKEESTDVRRCIAKILQMSYGDAEKQRKRKLAESNGHSKERM